MGNKKRPRVGLVLSGGAARGLAHIGVLSVLEEYKIPIDLITGASFGSIVGGYYACGYSSVEMLKKARDFRLWTIKNQTKPAQAYLSGEKAEDVFKKDLKNIYIEELPIPLYILSTDLKNGQMFVFEKGPLSIAMRASSSFPGLFDPLSYKGHLFVDGGILNSLLLEIAHRKGAEVIIYSDVSIFGVIYRKKIVGFFTNMLLNLFRVKRFRPVKETAKLSTFALFSRVLYLIEKHKKMCEQYRKSLPDVIIEPDVDGIKPLEFEKVDEGFRAGREAALKKIDKIVNLINNGIF